MSATPPDRTSGQQPPGTPRDSDVGDRTPPSAAPPAGWYPTPAGGQQYWDGASWLALPPPPPPNNDVGYAGESDASDPAAKPRRSTRWPWIAGAVALILALSGGGIAWKLADDARVAAEVAEKKAAEEQREEDRQEAAAAAQKRRDDAERSERRASVTEIEASVRTMAEGHASDGIIDAPILEVTCSPVGGGSTDDLTEQTTVFECFVGNEDNGDGTMSGYTYNATMNWSSGSYTYGLGAP